MEPLKRRVKSWIARAFEAAEAIAWDERYAALRERYDIDPTFRFNGRDVRLYGEGAISLGRDSYIGSLSRVQAADGHHIAVGQGCRLGHNLSIYTRSPKADDDFSSEVGQRTGDVAIGDFVWIGVNVVVLPGTTIGDNAVIGANSVVAGVIPANEIWGGVPARRIRAKGERDPGSST